MFRPLVLITALMAATPANAQDASVTTGYQIAIAGIEIGELAVRYEETGEAYALNFDGGFRFLFITGAAQGQVTGAKGKDRFAPEAYRMQFDGPTRVVISDIRFSEGRPDRWSITPEPEPEWLEGRIPLDDGDMPGAVDPISAFLVPATSPAEACTRQQKVFSGFVRFDLTLTPGAEAEDGVIPCNIRYEPISGHRADSENVERLRSGGSLKVSMSELVPGVWAPHYIGLRTSVGTLSFERMK